MELLEWIHNIDAQILLFIQQYLRSDLFTWLWKGITFLGDGGWFWIVLGLLFLFPKKTRKAGVTALLALAIGAVVTNLCLKDLVARIRPYDSVEGLVPLVARLKDYSFPSGHTMASFACASVFWHYRDTFKKWSIVALVLAFCVAFSRLYLYVHFPTDVLCGGLLGWLFGWIACRIADRVRLKKTV